MKSVLILGSGNAFCSDGRAQACFLLEDGSGELMLLDCGATSLMQLNRLGVNVRPVDRLLITHFHGDHIGGIPFLLLHFQYILHRTIPFELLGPVGLRESVGRLFEDMYGGVKLAFELRYTELSDRSIFQAGSFSIESVAVSHRAESLGYRITGSSGRSFAFSGDTRWCENLERLYAGIDVGLLELSLDRQPEEGTSHMSLDEMIQVRSRLRAKRLYFNHVYNHLADAALAYNSGHPGFGQPVSDGQRIDFDLKAIAGPEIHKF